MSLKCCRWIFILLALTSIHIDMEAQAPGANVAERFRNVGEEVFVEQVYLHADRSFYLAGETVWFKIYCINGRSGGLAGLSKVASVELLDAENVPVVQVKVPLDSGAGNGYLDLPAGLKTGGFVIRAYTSWMKNFAPDFYFHQKLAIVNTLEEGAGIPIAEDGSVDVNFFPEGSQLVQGLHSNVAFRVKGNPDKVDGVTGLIITQENDTVLHFNAGQKGVGNFRFTPQRNTLYKAVLLLKNGERVIKNLPAVQEAGYVLQVQEAASGGSLQIDVQSSDQQGKALLLLHHEQQLFGEHTVDIKNGKGSVTVSKKDLGFGIVHISLFDAQQQLAGTRPFFNKPERLHHVQAELEKPTYDLRSKVSLKLATTGANREPLPATLSVSVSLVDSLSGANETDIFSAYFLHSGTPGVSLPPHFDMDSILAFPNALLDNLVLVCAKPRFDWKRILNNEPLELRHLPEPEGHVVSGRVVHRLTGAPAAGVQAFLSFPGKDFKLFSAKSQPDGSLYFNTKNVYGQRLAVALLGDQDSLLRIDLNNPFSDVFAAADSDKFAVSTQSTQALLQRSINMQVWRSFYGSRQAEVQAAKKDTAAFYGKPTTAYVLDDYTRFTTLEEVMVEYVRALAVRKRQGNSRIIMFGMEDGIAAPTKMPFVLLDGLPMFDAGNRIMGLDPRKVQRLEVVTPNYWMGFAKMEGIASFRTYDGLLGGFRLDTTHTIMDFDALQNKRKFYSPAYNTNLEKNDRRADFRTLLYWNPDVNTVNNGNSSVDFFTSDVPGRYAVTIQGIGANGAIFFTRKFFEVKASE